MDCSGVPGPEWHHLLGPLFASPPPLLFLLMATKESSEQRWEEHSRRSQIRQRLLGSFAETGEGPRWGWAGPGLSRDAFPRRGWHKAVGQCPTCCPGGQEQTEDRGSHKGVTLSLYPSPSSFHIQARSDLSLIWHLARLNRLCLPREYTQALPSSKALTSD